MKGEKRKEDRKKEKTGQKQLTNRWNDATHSAAASILSLTLSGARADDHLWPSCWDSIGSPTTRETGGTFLLCFFSSSSSFFHSRFPTSPNPGPTLHQLFFFKYKIQTGWKIPVEIPTLQRENTPRDCVCVFVTQRSMAIRGFRRKKKKLYHTTSILIWYGKN